MTKQTYIRQRNNKKWWETMFDNKYLKTYVDIITPELTAKQISFLLRELHMKRRAKILDLACGYGRHTLALARQGYEVTGVDLSKHFIKIARSEAKRQNIHAIFIHKDMRAIAYKNKFDIVLNLFTSFGYFEHDKDNITVLKCIARALKSGGKFLIDLNTVTNPIIRIAEKGMRDRATGLLTMQRKKRLSNGLIVTTKNTFDPLTMRWHMERSWKERGTLQNYTTSIRMFTFPELKQLLEASGLHVKKIWGNFDGSPLELNSPRLIVLAQK